MSGSSGRWHSKWDFRDSEAFSENFIDNDSPRKIREPSSPSRGSHRHESHRRERIMLLGRENDNIRPCIGLDEWRWQHRSRSPQNGLGSSYRSRSQSRSRSPAYDYRREPALTERNIGKSGGSATICRDFIAGRCRRGSSCRFAHHDGRMDVAFEKGNADDVYRDRDDNCRNQHNYPDRNHDRETYRRVLTPCKFFSLGNCRNGNYCKFSHQVEENFRPHRQGSECKLERNPAFDERRALQWQNENSGALIGVDNISKKHSSSLYSETPSLSHISFFPTMQLDTTSECSYVNHYHYDIPEPQASGDPYAGHNPNFEDKLNAYTIHGKYIVGSDRMCITPNRPMNVQPVQSVFQNDPHVNVRPNLSINPTVGQLQLSLNPSMNALVGSGVSSGDPRVKFLPPASTLPSFTSSGENGMQTSHNHSSFSDSDNAGDGPRGDQSVSFQSSSRVNLSSALGQWSLPVHSRGGNGMQTSHDFTTFLNDKAADGSDLGSANKRQLVPNHSRVSNEQLAQLTHLSRSLAQLLERQQQRNQPSQAAVVKQYDPICDITAQKMPKSVNQMSPDIVELKSVDNGLCFENVNVNQQEPYKICRDGENCGKIAEGERKAPENKLSENITADIGDEDGKKSKDLKGLRSFKFALAEYTKELLKPAWKDGKVNKETYKTIVKKVVDKVIETRGPQIPQTKEKIDQYLSCSKTKIEKLILGYLGKYKT